MLSQIGENISALKKRIDAIARSAGRDTNDIQLVAVTKHRPLDQTDAVLETGHRVLGENRVSELLPKIEHYTNNIEPPIQWHFIGHLQSRKVKEIVGKVALIHSVDSLKLTQALQRRADMADTTADFLLQFNVSGEASKYGLVPAEAESIAREIAQLDRVTCRGLMTMAPFYDDPEKTRPVFRRLRELRDHLRDLNLDQLDLKHLSMGMTNDYEIAVQEGATLVRVGTALFEMEGTPQ
jgi:PLP dependent protein